MKQDFEHRLEQAVGADRVLREEPMKKHTTFRIGGPAQYMVMPRTKEEVQEVIRLCRKEEMPWYIIGNGSNLLVSDRGYRGVVIQLFRDFGDIRLEGTRICAQPARPWPRSLRRPEEQPGRLEFAAGIPGTLGGACIMNAGAYGGEMKDVLEEVTVLTSRES